MCTFAFAGVEPSSWSRRFSLQNFSQYQNKRADCSLRSYKVRELAQLTKLDYGENLTVFLQHQCFPLSPSRSLVISWFCSVANLCFYQHHFVFSFSQEESLQTENETSAGAPVGGAMAPARNVRTVSAEKFFCENEVHALGVLDLAQPIPFSTLFSRHEIKAFGANFSVATFELLDAPGFSVERETGSALDICC